MTKYLLLFFLMCAMEVSYAQAPEIEWQNTIGGSGLDGLFSVLQTTDGGYFLGGYSASGISGDKTEVNLGGFDYWIVKTDASGNIEWQNTLGGSSYDDLYSAIQTPDGGYLLGGFSSSGISGDKTEASFGDYDYWTIKTDASGNVEWQKVYGGNSTDYLIELIQTTDGGYLLAGVSKSAISGNKTEVNIGDYDYWIIKTDFDGNIEWQNTIGGSAYDFLQSVIQTSDGGFLLGGYSQSNISSDKTENNSGYRNYWIVKTDADGNVEWDNTIGGDIEDYLYSVVQTSDGGFLLGGHSVSGISGDKTEAAVMGSFDFWIVKTDAEGSIVWQKVIGGNNGDYLYDMIGTDDGGFLLGGTSQSGISGDKTEENFGSIDYWIVKTNAGGEIEWDKTLGGIASDYQKDMIQTTDGGFLIGGYSGSGISGNKTEASLGVTDYWIVKLAGQVCPVPPDIIVAGVTATTANLSWGAVAEADQYVFAIRDNTTGERWNRQTTDTFMVLTALEAGHSYTVRLRSVCYPTEISTPGPATDFTTPLRLGDSQTEWNIFPNPGNGDFTLQFSGLNTTLVLAEVFNLTGAMVYTEMFQTENGSMTETLSLNHLPEGAYVLHMTAGEQVFMEQLIIQH